MICKYYVNENKARAIEKISITCFISPQDKNSNVQCFEETEQYRW